MGPTRRQGAVKARPEPQDRHARIILCPLCRHQEPTCVIDVRRRVFACGNCERSGPVATLPTREIPDGVRWELDE